MANFYDQAIALGQTQMAPAGWFVQGSEAERALGQYDENGRFISGYQSYFNNVPLAEPYWRKLGYTGQVSADEENPRPTPDLLKWMESRGLKMGHNPDAGQNAMFGSNGQLIAGSEYSVDDTGNFLRDAGIVIAGGYFGGNAAFGGASGANGVANAVRTAGTTSFGSGALPSFAGGDLGLGIGAEFGAGSGGLGGFSGGLGTGGLGASLGSTLAESFPIDFGLDGLQRFITTGLRSPPPLAGPSAGGGGIGTLGTIPPGSLPDLSPLKPMGPFVSNASGGLPWGNIVRGGVDILSGLYGMSQAGRIRDASDPFGQYRQMYGDQLAALMADPSLLTKQPGYRAGIEAIDNSAAATGYFGGGNHQVGLARYGGKTFDETVARLAQLAGAGQTPGAGQAQAADLTGQGIASIGYGLSRFLPNTAAGSSSPFSGFNLGKLFGFGG